MFFGMMGAMALSFNACSSDDALVDNPNYDKETSSVTASFIFNVASNSDKATRQGKTSVQGEGENFRGLNDAVLLAYRTGGKYFADAAAAAADAVHRYDFPTLLAADAVNNDGDRSNRILELSIPTETDAMMFYGKAPKGSLSDVEGGKVVYNTEGMKANQFSFESVARVDGNKDKFLQTCDYIAFALTRIAGASANYTVNTTTYPSWTGDATISTTWKELGRLYTVNNDGDDTNNGRTLTALEDILGQMYAKFTSLNTGEYRAGSGSAVFYMVKDIYDAIDAVKTATATSPYERLAIELSTAISNRISRYFTHDGTLTGFTSPENVKDDVVPAVLSEEEWNNRFKNVAADDLADFPVTTFMLPRGATVLTINDGTFAYDFTKRVTDKAISIVPESYKFPVELMYRCNSWLRTSNTEKKTSDYPDGVGHWDTQADWTDDWSAAKSTVTSSTRAAALGQNINYGVAMLDSKVSVKDDVTQYQDNRKHFFPLEENATIDVNKLDITLTGILIGGQPEKVNWEFLPAAGTTFTQVIFDSAINGTSGIAAPKAAGASTASNYTMVFDNYNSSGTQDDEVRVALEFKNNGDDFWGRDNIVRKDGTFYLIGKLNLGSNTISNWDTYYQVPPLDASGNSQKITRIFVQDYVTTANFVLNTTSLQGAYVTVPDLRSAQLSFGLSVDIDWRPGLSFTSELGGDN